jgi:hypothetical protein
LAASALLAAATGRGLLRKGNRHGCKENRNGGKFEQHHDDDEDEDEDSFEECVCWKL